MVRRYFGLFFAACSSWAAVVAQSPAEVIVQRSVANTNADWAAAPQYDFSERDVITKNGKRTVRTYEVLMIEASPYNKVVAIDGHSLSAAEQAAEERKLQQETDRRHKESPVVTQNRVAQFRKERRQDHALMAEMVKAFDYKLEGEETIDGRRCFVLEATPKPANRPPSRETQVLKGMRGKMWVDTAAYEWVRVHAEVFRPVTFGLFIARVKPGTEFTLEQRPVQGSLWLPSHFSMAVTARVLLFSRNSRDDETYWYYRLATDRQSPKATRR